MKDRHLKQAKATRNYEGLRPPLILGLADWDGNASVIPKAEH